MSRTDRLVAWIEANQDKSEDLGPVWWTLLVFVVGGVIGMALS